ncbi:unnamed protein product [Rhodiola kirilowii]
MPTQMTLRLTDRSSRYPRGILKDVPVKVGNFHIPGDFVVIEMEEDTEIPILLGRPFLYTAGAIFDTTKGSITMRVGDEEIEFNLDKAQKSPSSTMSCNYIDFVDGFELLDISLLPTQDIDLDNELPEHVDCWAILDDGGKGKTKSDKGKESCSVELKALPTSLRYEFLGPNSTLPIIVNASLNNNETLRLLDVIREHKGAIGYSIDDLKGISPSLCMHRINLEDDSVPSRDHARRLNPIVGEVVKKEILKMLDAGIIFPIADSNWVSPIHVVPKKGGMTVVKNVKNEGIVLGHLVLKRGIEVDKAKVEVIEKFPPPKDVKGIRSFLGHAGFYRRFIKDFSKIARPLTNLLCNDTKFHFDEDCLMAFEKLKKALVSAPIIQPPNWDSPFELMCDVSDYAIGAVLGQRVDKKLHAIHYTSKVLNGTQLNYSTTEKEL